MAATVRIGTCSWADEALSKYFYPPKLPAKERLAWYAEHFDTVEVDSTYYRLPSESMVQGWAERTPDGFTMHVKAFGLMTRHPVKAETIPEDLRSEMPVDERGRVDRPPRELRGEIFRRFLEALEPLRAAGKLGGILFQLPPYIVYKDIVARLPRVGARADSAGTRCSSSSATALGWTTRTARRASPSSSGSAPATSSSTPRARTRPRTSSRPWWRRPRPTAYVRFHGRNLGTWNKRGGSAAERFDYLYSDEELGEWVGPLRGARRPVRAGLRLLQQQRVVGGSRQPARPCLAGGDERAAAAPAPRREQDRGERRNVAWPRERPLHRARRGCRPRAVRPSRRRGRAPARRLELRVGQPAAARRLRRRAGVRRVHASRPGRPVSVAARRDGLASRAGRAAGADTRHLSRFRAARPSDGRMGRAAAGARDRLGRGRADGGRRRGLRSSPPCRRDSRASSGTTTRTTCRRAESHSRTARPPCKRSGWGTPAGACSSTRR